MASNLKIPPDKGGSVAENDDVNPVGHGGERPDPTEDVGGPVDNVSTGVAEVRVEVSDVHEGNPVIDGPELKTGAGAPPAAGRLDGDVGGQMSPRGIRRILVERISELQQDGAEEVADMVMGEGVPTAVRVLASPQALVSAVQFAADTGVVSSAGPSDEFITVGAGRKGSKRRKRGPSDDGKKTSKSHRGAGGRGRGSGRGRGRGRGAAVRAGAGERGRATLHTSSVDSKLQELVREEAPGLSEEQARRVSARLLKMNTDDRNAALVSADTLHRLAAKEAVVEPAGGGISRAEKEREFGRQLYIKVLANGFGTGQAREIAKELLSLPVERLRALLQSKAELKREVQRVRPQLGGPAREASSAKKGSQASAKAAKKKPQAPLRAGKRRNMNGGTSAAPKLSPALTAGAPGVKKGSAWELAILGENGRWISRRNEDTSGDSDEDGTNRNPGGQALRNLPIAKESGPERPEDTDLAAALECSAGTNPGLCAGFVIRVKGAAVSVLYGRNEVAQIKRPTRGASSKVRFGDAVVLAKRVQFVSGKTANVTYGFAALKKGERFVPPTEKMAAMKAVMLVAAGDSADGVAVLPALGTKIVVPAATADELCKMSDPEVPAGGACDFKGGAVGGTGTISLPVGSSFFFYPTFLGGKVLLDRVCSFGVSIAGAGSANDVPATSVDLCPGFLLPDSRVQALAGQYLQVEAMPFVDASRHAFVYGMGANGVHQMLVAQGDTRQDFLYHKRVEEVMVKAEAIRSRRVTSQRERGELLSEARKCLVVPEAAYLEKYAVWLKRDMKTAERRGDRLRVVVGCFVDEECTAGSIYNTEDIPLLNQDSFPWIVSVTLLDGHVQCFSFDGRDRFVLSDASRVGKKLALIELDSFAGGVGTLPVPGVLVPEPLAHDVGQRPTTVKPGVDVLVSLPAGDNRRQLLIDKCSASVYRTKGSLEILSVPFATPAKAKQFVLDTAENARGIFAMLKSELYCKGTLTLTCDLGSGPKAASIVAGELFYLLRATGVMPIGGSRYRIATAMPMLEAAHLLHFQNCYVQLDNKKFKVLRNDHDEYVHLDTKKAPKSILKYYRKVPEKFSATEGVDRKSWYQIQNLPRWVTQNGLLDTLSSLRWWPDSAGNLLVSRSTHYPVAFFALEREQHRSRSSIPVSITVGGRPCAVMPSAPPPSTIVRRAAPSFCSQQSLAALASFPAQTAWTCSAKTTNLVNAKYKKRRREFLPSDSAPLADNLVDSKNLRDKVGIAGKIRFQRKTASSRMALPAARVELGSDVESAVEPSLGDQLLSEVKDVLPQEHMGLASVIAETIYRGAASDGEVGRLLEGETLQFLVAATLANLNGSRSGGGDGVNMDMTPEFKAEDDDGDLDSLADMSDIFEFQSTEGSDIDDSSASDDDTNASSDSNDSQSSEEGDDVTEDEHEISESGEASTEELAQTEVVSSARAATSQGLHGDGSEVPWPEDSAPVLGPPAPWGPATPSFLTLEREARDSFIAALDRTQVRGVDKKQ